MTKKKFNTEAETPENQRNLVTSGAKKKFTRHDLNRLVPMTKNQKLFQDAYTSGVEVIFQLGAAGSGKTAIALSEAFNEVLDPDSPYEKVIIIRSAVSVRDVGFLPGDLDEKSDCYELPYVDTARAIFKYKEPYYNLKACGLLEFALTSYTRGLNFGQEGSPVIVILDEAQNLDFDEIDTVYTRLCKGSKIIICGDGKQSDIQRYKKQESGLAKFVSIFDSLHKYEDTANDYSNMLIPPFEEYDYSTESLPDYVIINYEPQDCLRSDKVRKYLITKHNMSL